MASSEGICFENFVELTDIDIDMEVKSECDTDEENNCNSRSFDDGFNVEFIIPERQTPIESAPEETLLRPDSVTHDSTPDYSEESDTCDSDNEDAKDFEDEPEVELDEIAVRQELVEVALDPSSLFYVKQDKKPHVNQKGQSDQQSLQLRSVEEPKRLQELSVIAEQSTIPENSGVDGISLPTSLLPDLGNTFLSLPTPNTKCKGSAVTAALRRVKRKPIREPLEPLIENECSSNNVDYLKHGSYNNFDTQNDKFGSEVANEKEQKRRGGDSDSDDEKMSSGPPSPCISDSESKEQKDIRTNSPAITKRKRGRPRIKPLDFRERTAIKRTHKRRKVRKKIKVKNKSSNSNDLKFKKELMGESAQVLEELSSTVKEVVNDLTKDMTECGLSDSVNDNSAETECDKSIGENLKKGRKLKKVKKKPSIFDEVKMEYTILNENETKEKPKRIRRRDKKSRELAALSKPESFDCTECGRKFKEKSHLATHARAHIDIRNFKCNRCGNLFKTKTSLFFHMKTHSDAPFICDKCNKTYPERRMLMRHIRVVHSSQNLYSCDQCGREFKSVNNLNLHYTLHTGVKPFTCNHCGKSFVYKSTYIAHMKGHDADNSFTCELCPKTYNSKAEFRRLCNHHSEARPWLCTVCGKGYPLKGTLKNHMKTHEPEKPFKCTECPKSFMKKQSFECHLKIHAGESPQFMCDQCSQSYFNVFALKRHYLKHTSERRFACEVCSKAFWMKDALKVHMRTHSSVKMFPCLQCPKAFAHKHTLDAHSRTHLDVQPYSCNVCQKTFIHKYNLARHERQHLLGSSMPVMPSSILPPGPQALPISLMMLPPSPTSTTLHIL